VSRLIILCLAVGMVVAGVATWTVGGALVVGGLSLAGLTFVFDIDVTRDNGGGQ
jgi:Flp pilus assembly protein TadB